ncbi:MAG: 50S ribosomal protein L17 [Magnetococcales bacterium]|nr:50S ribosomal protein L17 [Magnetococcales bacterium]MBF0321991.1 50S ribosomal protein L17 [Magnetococcales bacterium]
MRHRKCVRKLNRDSAHRKSLISNMLGSLFIHERIETTDTKAKVLKRFADRMITLGKRGDLHARRMALRTIKNQDAVHKLFNDIAERNRNRPGGYTRVLKTRFRYGDCAAMSLIELVERSASGGGQVAGDGK